MFVPTVSIATVCSSLCSLPHFISTLIEIINTSVLTLKTFSLTCLAWHNVCKCNREHKKLKQINSPWCFNCYCLRFAVRPTCDFGHVLPTVRYGSVWKSCRKSHTDESLLLFKFDICSSVCGLYYGLTSMEFCTEPQQLLAQFYTQFARLNLTQIHNLIRNVTKCIKFCFYSLPSRCI